MDANVEIDLCNIFEDRIRGETLIETAQRYAFYVSIKMGKDASFDGTKLVNYYGGLLEMTKVSCYYLLSYNNYFNNKSLGK